jgi:YD repeat-containing protein
MLVPRPIPYAANAARGNAGATRRSALEPAQEREDPRVRAFGRLLQDIDEDGNVVAYGYDADGRRISDTDPNGPKHIQRSYDAAGEVLSIQDFATGVSSTYT